MGIFSDPDEDDELFDFFMLHEISEGKNESSNSKNF